MSDLFVTIMGILVPVTVMLGLLAFAPSISTIRRWFRGER
jgi:thiosulfate reductase cytochrome b subunit